MELITTTCQKKCFGFDSYHGSCCRLENRDYIIGPIHDPHEFLDRLNKHYSQNFKYSDIFIEYEEGSKLFPNKFNWQKESAYPALRINLTTSDNSCIFYNNQLKLCTVYSIRPSICSSFLCDYLRGELEKTKSLS
jgi:Fe-S-cluster containining protein